MSNDIEYELLERVKIINDRVKLLDDRMRNTNEQIVLLYKIIDRAMNKVIELNKNDKIEQTELLKS